MGFDWEIFSKNLFYDKPPNEFVTSSICYLKNIMENLKKDDIWKKKWRPYWIYMGLKAINRFSKHYMLTFNFHKKYLRGQQVPFSRKIFLIYGLVLGYNKLLTELYIHANPRRDEIQYISTLTNDLK